MANVGETVIAAVALTTSAGVKPLMDDDEQIARELYERWGRSPLLPGCNTHLILRPGKTSCKQS